MAKTFGLYWFLRNSASSHAVFIFFRPLLQTVQTLAMPKTPPDRSREVAVDTALCTIGAAGVLEPGFPAPRVFSPRPEAGEHVVNRGRVVAEGRFFGHLGTFSVPPARDPWPSAGTF